MAIIRKNWKPEEAENWTREDWIVIIISPLCYVGLSVGIALSFLFMKTGFIILGITIILIILMHWIIDPKLKAISTDFEKKQLHYLEELEKIMRWEERS